MEKQCDKCGRYISDLDYANGGGLCDSCRDNDYTKIKDDTCVDNPNNDESHICIKCANIPLQ
jgi:hypothetical protein